MQLKTILFSSLLVITAKTNLLYSGLIHTDPYNIKKTSLALAPVFSGPRGFGVFTMFNSYINTKLMLNYTGNFFPLVMADDKYYDAGASMSFTNNKKEKLFMYNNIGLDIHFSDKKVNKKTQVLLNSSTSGAGSYKKTVNTIIDVETYKRKVWAVYAGMMAQTGRERFYKEDVDKPTSYNLLNNSNGSSVNIKDKSNANYGQSVFANSAIYNLEFGLKNKAIFATCYKDKTYGKKHQDVHADWYIIAVLPVSSSFDKDVYRNGNTSTKYTIIDNTKPKPGFKIGFNFRTSLRSNYYLGGDFGYLPSLVTGNVMHFSFRLGYNLCFGKVQYEVDPDAEASK